MNLPEFGKQLQALRKARRWSQEALIEALDALARTGPPAEYRVIDSTLLSRWERAHRQKGRTWKPTRPYLLHLICLFAPHLDLAHAQAWAAQAGYTINAAELQAWFPSSTAVPSQAIATMVLPHNLPTILTSFVGREAEITRLMAHLATPTTRLITLVGEGGGGKTRLALEVAHRVINQSSDLFPAGLYFVPLADVSAGFVVSAVANALGLSPAGAEEPQQQLLAYLQQHRLLLILDNVEHLIATATPLLSVILQAAPGVHLLVTARERLNLAEEWVLALGGLPFPASAVAGPDTPAAPALSANGLAAMDDAMQLFLARAQQADATFAQRIDPQQSAAMARICGLLQGLPLGIEMAAAWVHILSCTEIADEIAHNLDFLSTPHRAAPARQRTMRAVFNHSWQLLAVEEQQALRRLAVFRGGFTWATAAQVAGATLPLLAQLTDKSLVQRSDPAPEAANAQTRYGLHPLVQHYADEQLRLAGETTDYQARHAHWMAHFLATQRAALQSAQQRAALSAIQAEIENVRAAWPWLLTHLPTAQSDLTPLVEQVSQGVDTLFHFYDMRSWFQEGEMVFGQLAHCLSVVSPALSAPAVAAPAQSLWRLQAKAQARQGWFAFHLGRYTESRRLLTESLHRLQELGAAADTIFNLTYLGPLLRQLGEFAQATTYLQEAQRLAQQHNDWLGVSNALNNLGHIALVQGDLAEVRRLCQQALQIKRASGDRWGMTLSLGYLGRAAQYSEDYAVAQKLFAECLTIARELEDRRGAAFALQCLGDTAYAAGALAEAQRHYQESLSLYRAIGNRSESSITLARLGETWRAVGDRSQARQLLHAALTLAWSLPSTPGLLAALLGLAALALADGQPAQARPVLRFVYAHPAGSRQQRQQAAQLLTAAGATATDDPAWELTTYVQTVLGEVQAVDPAAVSV